MGNVLFPELTRAQFYVYQQIASGVCLPTGAAQHTINVLLTNNFIERISDRVVGSDLFGTITIPQYQPTLIRHMEWCAWCAEQDEDDE